VLPRHSRRLPWSGAPPLPDSVESECGLFVEYVDLLEISLSRVSRRFFFTPAPYFFHTSPPPQARGGIRPSCGEVFFFTQEPVGSSGASVALMGTSVFFHTSPIPSPDLITSPPPQARGGIRPSCGELPGASQEPVGSSGASVALMGTSGPPTPHHSACCARGEQRPAEPGRAWPSAEEKKRNRSTARCGHQNGNRGPWLCFLYP
jgi:hypothetical protein